MEGIEALPVITHNVYCYRAEGFSRVPTTYILWSLDASSEYPQHIFYKAKTLLMGTHNIIFLTRIGEKNLELSSKYSSLTSSLFLVLILTRYAPSYVLVKGSRWCYMHKENMKQKDCSRACISTHLLLCMLH